MSLPSSSAAAQPTSPIPSHALCPEHPERAAVSTCGRCGRFVCDECHSGPGACASCVTQQLAALPSLAGRGKIASFLLFATVALEGVTSLLSLVVTNETENLLLALGLAFLGIGLFVVYVCTVVFFLRWLHLAVRTTNALGGDIGMTPGWAVGWWFVPFANLVKPYHAVRGVLSNLGGEAAVAKANVGTWWALWLIGNVVSNISARMELSDTFSSSSTGSMAGPLLGLVAAALSVGAAFLAVGVIRTVQASLPEAIRSAR